MTQPFIRRLEIDWDRIPPDSYLRDIPALAGTEALDFSPGVTVFTGENGSGKSTLLEAMAIAAGFNPEGGTRNYVFSTRDSHSELWDALRLVRGARKPRWGYFLRAESFYNVATREETYAREGGVPSAGYHRKSHGESFLALARDNFRGDGLYFLDEPEAALSPQRQLTLLAEIHRCAGAGAQFFLVTHSPILQGIPGARLLTFDGGPIRPIAWEDTESTRITAMFVNRREQLLHHLLGEE